MTNWESALREHREVVAAYVEHLRTVPEAEWHQPMRGRTWTPAEEALHLVRSYELPLGDGRMRIRVNTVMAWLLRNVYLRYLLWRKRFHTGARAPSEVRPSREESSALSRDALIERLITTSNAGADALRRASAERPNFRLEHAYFGSLTPFMGLRLLNAHTRHHHTLSTSTRR